MNNWKAVYGLFTPGGDPVWECPECGGGRHIMGVETTENYSWVCPNCKTKLKYPWEKDNEKDNY